MKKLFSLLTLALLTLSVGATTVTDVITASNLAATGTTYTDFSGVQINTAVYAGQSALNDNANIQLRSKNSNSGIVSTTSGGKLVSVKITVASGSNTIDVYGSNTAYTAASDLYNSSSQGTKVGSTAETATITVDGDYEYVGIRSNNGAVYISSIEVTWETEGGDTPEPTVAAPVFNPNGGEIPGSTEVTVSCATENASIFLYKVVDGEIDYTTQQYYFQSGTFYVNETATYAAYATWSDYTSDTTYVTFTKVVPTVATPTFDPASGTTFDDELIVTISCATPGAKILYEYGDVMEEVEAPVTITLTESATITAIASLEGYQTSQEATATYTKVEPWEGTEHYVATDDKGDFGGSAGKFNVFKESRPGINLAFSNGTIAAAGGVTAYRIYKSSTITFTSQVGNITMIQFIGVAGNPVSNFGENVEGMTYDGNNGTWIGDAATVTFTATTNQVRATEIRVTVGERPVALNAPVIAPETNTVFAGSQQVTITCATEGAQVYYMIDEGEATLYEGPFTIDASCKVSAYSVLGEQTSATVSATYHLGTDINTIAEATTVGNYYIYNGEAVVTYQNGNYTWIRDNSGSGLIYGYQVPAMEQGDVIKDGWTANYTVYKNVPEFQYPMGVEKSEDDPVTVEPLVRETLTEANVNEYVVLKGISVLADTANTKKFYNAADSLILYNQFNLADSLVNFEEGKLYDVEGISYIFNETTVELYITKVTEVAAAQWQLGDVNHDTFVDVADVTALIGYILGNNTGEFYLEQANVDGDAENTIDVGDVTALIAIILGN